MVGLTAAEVSFAKASEWLTVVAGVDVETRQVERCAEALGREVAADERSVTEPTAAAHAPTLLELTLPRPAQALWKRTRDTLLAARGGLDDKVEGWRLDGGTLLAARWGHRVNTDIDLTVA